MTPGVAGWAAAAIVAAFVAGGLTHLIIEPHLTRS